MYNSLASIEERIRETLEEFQINSFTPINSTNDGRIVYQGYIVDKHKPNYQQLYIPFNEFPEYSNANDRRIKEYKK